MTSIILAGALGAVTITVLLLFRRLREDLDRQLTALRAERNSEWIMRAIVSAPHGITAPFAANGEDLGPPPALPDPLQGQQPVRSRKHLHLLPPIAAAMLAFAGGLREAFRSHRAQLIGLTAAGAVAGATVMLTLTPWKTDGHYQPPSTTPTVTAAPSPGTGTQPSAIPPSASESPSPSPSEPQPSLTASAGSTALALPPPAAAAPSATTPGRGRGTTPPGRKGPPASSPRATPSPPGRDGTPPGRPSEPPGRSGLCAGVHAGPVLDARLCLPGPGDR